jgi:hypothetical protein
LSPLASLLYLNVHSELLLVFGDLIRIFGYPPTAAGGIWVPKLSKCTSRSTNLLIGSREVQITVTLVKLTTCQADWVMTTCGAHMSDPPSSFLCLLPPLALISCWQLLPLSSLPLAWISRWQASQPLFARAPAQPTLSSVAAAVSIPSAHGRCRCLCGPNPVCAWPMPMPLPPRLRMATAVVRCSRCSAACSL